jgi:hypothetical protein
MYTTLFNVKTSAVEQFVLDCLRVSKTKEEVLKLMHLNLYNKIVNTLLFPFDSNNVFDVKKLTLTLNYLEFDVDVETLEQWEEFVKKLVVDYCDQNGLYLFESVVNDEKKVLVCA